MFICSFTLVDTASPSKDKKSLLRIEDEILRSLQVSDDISELLMDESLINTLQSSKKFAAEINQRM